MAGSVEALGPNSRTVTLHSGVRLSAALGVAMDSLTSGSTGQADVGTAVDRLPDQVASGDERCTIDAVDASTCAFPPSLTTTVFS